jgi:hypothetical protein
LPAYFSRTYGLQVGPYVILRDPGNNEFEVKVVKKNTRLYFTDDWAMLKNFYHIRDGAGMTMIYANRNLFLMRLADMYDEELLLSRKSRTHYISFKKVSLLSVKEFVYAFCSCI